MLLVLRIRVVSCVHVILKAPEVMQTYQVYPAVNQDLSVELVSSLLPLECSVGFGIRAVDMSLS